MLDEFTADELQTGETSIFVRCHGSGPPILLLHGFLLRHAHALCLAGDVTSAGGAEDVEGSYREALALASELGMRPLVAHCHLGLGKIYQRTGQREQAQKHFTTATTMYREMGLTYWLDRATTELKELA